MSKGGKVDTMLSLVIEGILVLSVLPALAGAYVTYSDDNNATIAAIAILALLELVLAAGFLRYAWGRASKM